MIKIEILRDKKNRIVSICSAGHSFYKKKGEDIVCSAVSAILQTAILGLSEYLNVRLDLVKKDGFLRFKLLFPPSKEASSILETMRLGLYQIAKKYPDYVEIVVASRP